MDRSPLTALVLSVLLVATAIGVPDPARGNLEDTGAFGQTSQPIADAQGPIEDVVAPTNGAPVFHLAGDELRVELATGVLDELAPGQAPEVVRLEPSFGQAAGFSVPVEAGEAEASQLWGPDGREVVPLTGTIPATTQPDLYDVVVPAVDERAHRALSVHDDWPDEPRIVLLADTQTGDPRALQDGFRESTGIHPMAPQDSDPRVPPDPGPFNESLERLLGVDIVNLEVDPSERWAAYRAAIERVNELEPDVVLFSGDLTFGQTTPGSYHHEYAEAWALLNGGQGLDGTDYAGIQAPTLVSPGNHDGYIQSGEDGFAFWRAHFGPPAFDRSLGETTFVSVNTYDWSELDRKALAYGVSAWGGQVREPQLAWLRTTLCEANGGTPVDEPAAIAGVGCEGGDDERVLTFSHHSPSWVQDPWKDAYEGIYRTCPCEGTPGLEQVARGVISFTTTGQGWSGDNRLALRETLRSFDVDLHAAGHTHRDRVARDVGDGTIVETPQKHRDGLRDTQLHLVQPDGDAREVAYEDGKALLEDGEGPLYIETTTTASDTDEYFGFRPLLWHQDAQLPSDALGIAPFETGFPASETLLEELAREPDRWNASHAELGLFSTPTFLSAEDAE